MSIFAELSECKKAGFGADSAEVQALLHKLQSHISVYYYTCADDILVGLGNMYVADERLKKNIDKYGEGTVEFVSEAIAVFCQER